MTRCARTANGATRREWSRQLPGTPRPPSTRAATPTPPNDALWGESRHDHPDAPARRRGHPWPLEHASAVPTIAGHGAQRAVHNPAAEAHATSTLRSDDQKPCSGRNLDRESPPIIHGAPKKMSIDHKIPRNGYDDAITILHLPIPVLSGVSLSAPADREPLHRSVPADPSPARVRIPHACSAVTERLTSSISWSSGPRTPRRSTRPRHAARRAA